MRNVRERLAVAWRRPVPDPLWQYLGDLGFTEEVEEDRAPIEWLVDQARRVLAAGRSSSPPPADNEIAKEAAGAAARARIDALSAIYAAWAHTDSDVQRFRDTVLVARDTPDFAAWIRKEGPFPTPRLLAPAEVAGWVLGQHNAAAPDGDGDRHAMELFKRWQPRVEEKPVIDLYYVGGRDERILTVDARSVLGELARLADKLADRYQWRPSEAATYLLSGRVPEVFVYTGSAVIRYGDIAATTRVTMTLDPALTPDQVAGIYSRLRTSMQPDPPARSLSVKHYQLARHAGPYVRMYVDHPSRVTRPGRPPRPGPTGLARFIEPIEGHSWSSLRQAWNTTHGTCQGADDRTWRYDRDSNFIRDTKDALTRLLNPGWKRPE